MTPRRQWLGWALAAYAGIIAVVCWGLLNLYHGAEQRLDQALGDRLLSTATTLATVTDGWQVSLAALGDSSVVGYLGLLENDFLRLGRQLELSEVSLTAADGKVLFSSSPSLVAGQPNDFWSLERQTVGAALDGQPAASRLYRLGNILQKSACAPVFDFDPEFDVNEVVAVVTVSGNPDFFDSLAQLERGAWITGLVVLLILIVLGILLIRINRSFEGYRESIRRQENLVAMGRMTAGIAHEIRNPLGIIRGAGEHLRRALEQAGVQDPVADFIPEEVDRLDHILKGYLAFGADKAGPGEAFDLALCLRRSSALVAGELAREGKKITLVEPLAAVPVWGDPLRLRQVILNLLLNAGDAMDHPGTIEIRTELLKGRVRVEILDQGCGLKGQDARQLFEPFRTSKEKGSGLGLALSRRIVEDSGGSLELLERADGPGARAVIELPVHDEQKGKEGDRG